MIMLRIGAFLLLVLALTILGRAEALPQELKPGDGVFCDTIEQIERFAAAKELDEEIAAINKEAGDVACANLTVLAIVGNAGKRLSTPYGSRVITEFLVVALQTPMGWRRIEPVVWYALMKTNDVGA
jgi:hypothetical protein